MNNHSTIPENRQPFPENTYPAKRSSPLLISEPPLQVLPSLACAIGDRQAIALQQVHYWINMPRIGKVWKGRKWIRNSRKEWREDNFPFWDKNTLDRIFDRLIDLGLLEVTTELSESPFDRSLWYTINYDILESKLNPQNGGIDYPKMGESETMPKNGNDTRSKAEPPITPKWGNGLPQNGVMIPYETTEYRDYQESQKIESQDSDIDSREDHVLREIRATHTPAPEKNSAEEETLRVQPPSKNRQPDSDSDHYPKRQPPPIPPIASHPLIPQNDPTKWRDRVSPSDKPPHIAIIYAWWYSQPTIGKPVIGRNSGVAGELAKAGITPDQIADYVIANGDDYRRWAQEKGGRPALMPLEHVRENIAASLAPTKSKEPKKDIRQQTTTVTYYPHPDPTKAKAGLKVTAAQLREYQQQFTEG